MKSWDANHAPVLKGVDPSGKVISVLCSEEGHLVMTPSAVGSDITKSFDDNYAPVFMGIDDNGLVQSLHVDYDGSILTGA